MSDHLLKLILRVLVDVPPERLASVLAFVQTQSVHTFEFVDGGIKESDIKKNLVPSQTIMVGGVSVAALLDTATRSAVKTKRCIVSDAQRIITSPTFPISGTIREVSFVELTPSELGFRRRPSIDSFVTREFCERWSQDNHSGCAIELCEPEDAPQLLVQYKGPPKGNVLYFAMKSQIDLHKFKCIFRLHGRDESVMLLDTICVNAKFTFEADDCLVFRLVKR